MRDALKLFRFMKPHLTLLFMATGTMLASSVLRGVSLWMIVPLIDVVVLNRPLLLPSWVPEPIPSWVAWFQTLSPITRLTVLVMGVAVLLFIKSVVFFFQTYWMNDVSLRFLRDLREALYRHYQQFSHDFFSKERTGEMVARITHDVVVLQNSVTEGITDLVYHTAQTVVYSAIVLAIDWKLGLAALLLIPAIGYPVVRVGRMLRKLSFQAQERMADLSARLIETLQGIRIVKAFTAEAKEAERFAQLNQAYYKSYAKMVKRREALAALTELIGTVGVLAILMVSGRAVLKSQMTLGTVGLFLAALLALQQPIRKLTRLHSVFQQAFAAARRVNEVFETEPSVQESPQAFDLPRFQREIRFEDVWFRYEDRFVLKGIQLTVPSGEIVAIVGPSGSGKTTLTSLLLRFYDPTKGRVTLDGFDIRQVRLTSLRSQIGLVTQDPFLFHDTIYANIAFGRPGASWDEVVRAAQMANADGFIRQLPNGYETSIGDFGGKLSGGERQRIAIARAILKDPPILILDEATSQLDSESERLVQEALDRIMHGRTVFLIAHRLSTLRKAHRIVVLDQGQIVQMGRHEQLIESAGLYRRLYELQVVS
jgi:subfamily B ATP-binding cassette protein MsbA